ncbi:CAP domain-containing protein [Paraconexibacter algicola]|uniref:CAP domain-containing protein n=1 Tax=Paraconexibacter algicola TaxID=2133960 RepID=UPI001304E069|nr:CAP domain-containing protein [Paraconexibacter algicola]
MPRRLLPPALLGAALLLAAPTAATAAPADRASALAAWQAAQVDAAVPAGWTGAVGGCDPGTESDASRAATLRTINTLRSFAGVPPVTLSDEYNRKALAAALMMRAASDLSHDPGPAWPCSSAEGREGAASSNLFLGLAGPAAMVGYVDDEGVASLGHRRWVLNPAATTFGTGSTGARDGSGPPTNALWVFGPSAPVAPGTLVAWPPAGWTPWEWVFADWTVAVGGDGQTVDLSAATVTVTLDGAPLTVSGIRDKGPGYGSGRTLSWQVAVPPTARTGDHVLEVTVGGATVDGAPTPISWRVSAFRAQGTGGGTGGGGGGTGSGGGTGTGGGTGSGGGTTTSVSFTRRPAITGASRGTTRVGALLRARTGLRGATRTTYRWRRDGATIRGATRSSYRVTRRDRGRRISVRITGRDAAGRTVVATSATVRVRR